MPELTASQTPVPLAHGGGEPALWSAMLVVVLVSATAAAYGRGVQELWARRGAGAVIAPWRVVGFGGGLLAVLVAYSPVVRPEASFAGHMSQHMLLLVVAGPLLAAGGAGLPFTLAAPRAGRRWLARLRACRLGRWARRPPILLVTAGAVHTGVLWGWHLPGPYVAAVDSPPVHLLEHASILFAAWLLWAAVVGAGPRRPSPPVRLLVLFGTGMPAAALGAVLTFAPAPLYPARTLEPAGPLADQQLAGLVMWVPMDVVLLTVAVGVFLRWLVRLDHAAPPGRDLLPGDPPAPGVPEVRTR